MLLEQLGRARALAQELGGAQALGGQIEFDLVARRQFNLTLLPDVKVLASGGSGGFGFDNSTYPIYPAEMWDPATGNWTTMASISVYRGYHSTALLLPDGRVLSAGGEITGASAEIFSPPYL